MRCMITSWRQKLVPMREKRTKYCWKAAFMAQISYIIFGHTKHYIWSSYGNGTQGDTGIFRQRSSEDWYISFQFEPCGGRQNELVWFAGGVTCWRGAHVFHSVYIFSEYSSRLIIWYIYYIKYLILFPVLKWKFILYFFWLSCASFANVWKKHLEVQGRLTARFLLEIGRKYGYHVLSAWNK